MWPWSRSIVIRCDMSEEVSVGYKSGYDEVRRPNWKVRSFSNKSVVSPNLVRGQGEDEVVKLKRMTFSRAGSETCGIVVLMGPMDHRRRTYGSLRIRACAPRKTTIGIIMLNNPGS